jgi:tetratricopeptide (TPR) repeat protein
MKDMFIKILIFLCSLFSFHNCIEISKESKLADNLYVEYLVAEINNRGIPTDIKYICEWYIPNKLARRDIFHNLTEREVLITIWRGESWRYYPYSNIKASAETLIPFYVEYGIPKSLKEIKREDLKDIGYGYLLYEKVNEKKEIKVEYDEQFGNITNWLIRFKEENKIIEIKPVRMSYGMVTTFNIIPQIRKARDLERELEEIINQEKKDVDIKKVQKINKENREKIEKILEFYPNYSNGYIDLGQIAAMENKMEIAESYFRKAIEADEENTTAYLYLLGFFRLTGIEKDSLKIAKVVEDKFSEDDEDACFSLAEFYKSKNMKEKALKFYEKAITIIERKIKDGEKLNTLLKKVRESYNELKNKNAKVVLQN